MFEVSREAVRKWLAGESIPDTKRIADISFQTGVKGEWLLTGHGPMSYSDGASEEAGHKEFFSPHVMRLARILSQVPEEKVQAILLLLGDRCVYIKGDAAQSSQQDVQVSEQDAVEGRKKVRTSPHVKITNPKNSKSQIAKNKKVFGGSHHG
jgi:hypothetical protein